jgi:hypothetical protein
LYLLLARGTPETQEVLMGAYSMDLRTRVLRDSGPKVIEVR